MSGQFLILTPEPPYPLHSGGAYRTASILHYFSRIGDVDLILLLESGEPALLPAGLARSQQAIALPRHSRSVLARYGRNARRALRGVPPLVDRLSGLGARIRGAIGSHRYDVGVVEHFWCAPYVTELKATCGTTILNLHNVESSLHARCAAADSGLRAAGHRRFARASRRLEAELLPKFDLVLCTSDTDAAAVRSIAPGARVAVYPNALPAVPLPVVTEDTNLVVFAGNFEYHPNVDAVQYFSREIWPSVLKQNPAARVRLVGRGDNFVRHSMLGNSGMEATGPVDDAFAEIARAAVSIAPLRAGSGTRIKILEAWAAGRAVVATRLAAEGLKAQDGENLILADDPLSFSDSIVTLLGNAELRCRLGAAGRDTFERHYTWDAAWASMDRHLSTVRATSHGGYTE